MIRGSDDSQRPAPTPRDDEVVDAYFDDIEVGYTEESEPLEADRSEMIAYARANDPYPIHTDPDIARRSPAM